MRFRSYLEEIGIGLEGSPLDIACGPFSLGCIYEDVHGHDNSPRAISCLKEKRISARLGDITRFDYPSKSFRYVVTFNPPMKPFRQRGDHREGIKRFLEELLRIAQERVIIRSDPIIPVLPIEYDPLIERRGENFIIYSARSDPTSYGEGAGSWSIPVAPSS
ncbi:MAG: class I SAM-dependent methyltransferase [Methanotrichaceae archaeon]|nr:class I SAM-dependent methyltransferase [Methanotrichaceae archaeon]